MKLKQSTTKLYQVTYTERGKTVEVLIKGMLTAKKFAEEKQGVLEVITLWY